MNPFNPEIAIKSSFLAKRRYAKFALNNPVIWTYFLRFCNEAIDAGYTTLSVSLVFERIRWETTVVTRSQDPFKITNDFKPYYARRFNYDFPHAKGAFVLHKIPSDIELI